MVAIAQTSTDSKTFSRSQTLRHPKPLTRRFSASNEDPFGRTIESTGTYKNTNKFRFSTKYYEDDWGLSYYGYRWYQADTGKWLSRDPLEEDGGLNLYAFAGNSPLELIDFLGLEWSDPDRENSKDGWAEVTCDCDDKVRDLAEKIKLDPEDFQEWLEDADGKGIPKIADELIKEKRTFRVPDEVHITFGYSGDRYTSLKDAAVSYEAKYAGKGYDVHKHDPSDKWWGSPREHIKGWVERKQSYIWIHLGHGAENAKGKLVLSETQKLFKLIGFGSTDLKPAHMLAEIRLHVCYAAEDKDGWLNHVAAGGALWATPKKTWSAWGFLRPLKEYPKETKTK